MGRILMTVGAMLLLAGALVHFGGRVLNFGRLPGDIVFQRGSFTLYFPLATSILLSLLLTGIVWMLRKF